MHMYMRACVSVHMCVCLCVSVHVCVLCVCVIAVEFLSKHGWPALGRTSQPLTRAQVLGSVILANSTSTSFISRLQL